MKRSFTSGPPDNDDRHGGDAPITARGKVHVLVVDDEKMIRSLLKMSLQRMGYEVTTADDGAEALDLFQTQQFDLVLLDIFMPKVDGFTVCSELRRDLGCADCDADRTQSPR